MTALNILRGIVAGILLLGVIAEKDEKKNKNLTLAFIAVLAFIAAANTIM